MPFIPYLSFQGQCAEAFAYYGKVFGATPQTSAFSEAPKDAGMPDLPPEQRSWLMHAQIETPDGVLMGADMPPQFGGVPQAGVSIIGAIMLGLGRALGETMAVTFVVGNANRLSASVMDPGSTIASRIANEFNEALGLQLHALIALGCILFFVTFVVLVIARLLVARVKRY